MLQMGNALWPILYSPKEIEAALGYSLGEDSYSLVCPPEAGKLTLAKERRNPGRLVSEAAQAIGEDYVKLNQVDVQQAKEHMTAGFEARFNAFKLEVEERMRTAFAETSDAPLVKVGESEGFLDALKTVLAWRVLGEHGMEHNPAAAQGTEERLKNRVERMIGSLGKPSSPDYFAYSKDREAPKGWTADLSEHSAGAHVQISAVRPCAPYFFVPHYELAQSSGHR